MLGNVGLVNVRELLRRLWGKYIPRSQLLSGVIWGSISYMPNLYLQRHVEPSWVSNNDSRRRVVFAKNI